MIYRLVDNQKRCVVVEGADVFLDPGRRYDDRVPVDADVIRAFPGLFVAADVEAATAAPGEKRTTRR